jgi:hypothetical protein
MAEEPVRRLGDLNARLLEQFANNATRRTITRQSAGAARKLLMAPTTPSLPLTRRKPLVPSAP